eukprot:c20787_g10_i7.p2 GENE.c20787_g10_i7~~c20787_g10_i7.p2  ORF type:complete len:101 (+),score=9.94 c20787_g10_i7:97-399(+)
MLRRLARTRVLGKTIDDAERGKRRHFETHFSLPPGEQQGVLVPFILTAGGGQSEIVGELLRSAARLSDRGEVPELQYLNASVSIALLRFAVQMAIATHKA